MGIDHYVKKRLQKTLHTNILEHAKTHGFYDGSKPRDVSTRLRLLWGKHLRLDPILCNSYQSSWIANIKAILPLVPPKVSAACIKFAVAAWATSERTGKNNYCPLCGAARLDTQRHLLGCMIVRQVATRISTPNDEDDLTAQKFLLSNNKGCISSIVMHSLMVHSVDDVCNWRRHGKCDKLAKPEHIIAHMLHTVRSHRWTLSALQRALQHLPTDRASFRANRTSGDGSGWRRTRTTTADGEDRNVRRRT